MRRAVLLEHRQRVGGDLVAFTANAGNDRSVSGRGQILPDGRGIIVLGKGNTLPTGTEVKAADIRAISYDSPRRGR